jgi:Asp-tRNA(Asn)/Glu-tRNA(Gln) amidotransferase C subunit
MSCQTISINQKNLLEYCGYLVNEDTEEASQDLLDLIKQIDLREKREEKFMNQLKKIIKIIIKKEAIRNEEY